MIQWSESFFVVVEAAALPCRHSMTDVELCLLQDACRIYTDACINVVNSNNQS
jgi:hypothetical protein